MSFRMPFERTLTTARFIHPDGTLVEKPVEVRSDPISGRTARVTFARAEEKEPSAGRLPEAPPLASDIAGCPFCRPQLTERTPCLPPEFSGAGRLERGRSVLFPNLFPYGRYSAVSLFDDRHFVEIGTADVESYADCFRNCRDYLARIRATDPESVFMAITQNHLPSAGGSLVHPHLQVHADRVAPNFVRFLQNRTTAHFGKHRSLLFSDYLAAEAVADERTIGAIGDWQWVAAFAPEGFYEIWGLLPDTVSFFSVSDRQWIDLARGVIAVQRYYRSLHRNGYNLGLIAVETLDSRLELRVRILVRANYAPWARNDHTGYEVMLGDMATFTLPEDTAREARPLFAA